MTIIIDSDGATFRITVPYHLHQIRDRLKDQVHGIDFDHPTRTWYIPVSALTANRIEDWVLRERRLNTTVEITDQAHEATDAAREAYDELRQTVNVIDIPDNDPLYPFQRIGVERLKRWGDGMLAWDVGAGKTVGALFTAVESQWMPMVVVCPAVVKYQWAEEVEKWFPELEVVVLEGMATDKDLPEADVIICNYSILNDRAAPGGGTYEGWVHQLCKRSPGCLVLDEAHAVKDPEAQRSKASMRLSKVVDHNILLTGTPIINTPLDLTHLLEITGNIDFWGGPWGFTHEHCFVYKRQRVDGHYYYEYEPKDLEKLKQLLDTLCMHRVRKQDVLDEMPPLTQTLVPVELTNRGEYNRAERDYLQWVADKARQDEAVQAALERGDKDQAKRIIAKAVHRAEAGGDMVKKGQLRMVSGKGKVRSAVQLIANAIEDGETPLVFTIHRDEVLGEIVKRLRKSYDLSVVDGTTPDKQREEARQRFQNGQSDAFLGTLQAIGEGLTLTQAQTIIFVELPWTAKDVVQGIGRAYARLNDVHGCNVLYLAGERTVDLDVWSTILEKKDIVARAIDGEVLEDEVEVMDGFTSRCEEELWRLLKGE